MVSDFELELLGPILNVTTVWNTVDTGDIYKQGGEVTDGLKMKKSHLPREEIKLQLMHSKPHKNNFPPHTNFNPIDDRLRKHKCNIN